jgi:hypothetical protein
MFLLLFIDKYVLNIDAGASFSDMQWRTSVNFISRQAAIGAVIAAVLVFAANANPDIGPSAPPYSALAMGSQQAQFYQGAATTLAEMLQTCRDKVLDDALDAFGEIAAHLKQM